MSLELITAIAIAIISPALSWWFNKRKTRAEIDNLIVDSAGDLIEQYRAQTKELRRQVDQLKDKVEHLRQDQIALDSVVGNANELALRAQLGVMILGEQLRRADLTPLITPQILAQMTTDELRQKVQELQGD